MEMKNTISIFRLFLGSLTALILSVILLLIISVVATSLALNQGVLLPANFVETELSKVEDALSEQFNADLLPLYSSYVLIDVDYGVLESNMNASDRLKTQNYLLYGHRSYYDRYKQIFLDNGDVLVVKYQLLAHFQNPYLHRLIPFPEVTFVAIVLSLILLFSIITAWRFSKKLKRNLVPIIQASEKIAQKDLDFEIIPTQIKEFHDALAAIDKLKTELNKSLHQQWQEEQQKKSVLSALAHDLKTPLTVIKGNAELLLEDDLEDDVLETMLYIQQGSNTIETYIETLMSVVNDTNVPLHPETISLAYLIEGVRTDALALCKTKEITLSTQNQFTAKSITIDRALMHRALMNLMDNAVRFSDRNTTIDFIITENREYLIFDIVDSGNGFSAESLKKGVLEFYTEDTARSGKHYGLGLSFANKVTELHHGLLEISNTQKGANVRMKIPK